MTANPRRVLIVQRHPVQYFAPLFARYSQIEGLELTVVYEELPPVGGRFDTEFGRQTDWGPKLLEGYRWTSLAARGTGLRKHRTLWDLVKRGRYDLVIAFGYNFSAAWVSLAAAKRFGARWGFVSDSHRLVARPGARRPGKRLFLIGLGLVVDLIAAQSVRSYAFYGRFARRKVRLLPHAVDDVRFSGALADSDGQRARHAGEPTTFLFVGKLISIKRVADLIAATKAVPSALTLIVGSGAEEPALRELASGCDRVQFLGFKSQEELPAIYAACDVVVLPSEQETYGLCVSEAAALGKPAIVSDACGVVDSLILDGESGFVYPVGDIEALRTAMEAMADSAVRERLARGIARRTQNWNSHENVRAFEALCRE